MYSSWQAHLEKFMEKYIAKRASSIKVSTRWYLLKNNSLYHGLTIQPIVNIISDKEFQPASWFLWGSIKNYKALGLYKTVHQKAILEEDMKRLYRIVISQSVF